MNNTVLVLLIILTLANLIANYFNYFIMIKTKDLQENLKRATNIKFIIHKQRRKIKCKQQYEKQ